VDEADEGVGVASRRVAWLERPGAGAVEEAAGVQRAASAGGGRGRRG
jgi:hypothetical protein